jgi:hypothetical protein
MKTQVSGYYHWPPIWVGTAPEIDGGTIVALNTLSEEVFRTTLSNGVTVKIRRDGLFLFDFSGAAIRAASETSPAKDVAAAFDEKANVILQRVRLFNGHLACLHDAIVFRQSVGLKWMVVSPGDLVQATMLDSPGFACADQRIAALVCSSYQATYAHGPHLMDWRVNSRDTIRTDTVEESFRMLNDILSHASPDALLLVDLYARSCHAHETHNHSLCLVIAWGLTEKLLTRHWERYLERNRKRTIDGAETSFINGERMDKLTGRDYTASVVSEILSLVGELPLDLYKHLSRVRKARNDWMHELKEVSRGESYLAVQVASRMLELIEGIKFAVHIGASIHTAG